MDNDQAGKAGAGERNRTLDLRITNALLYRLSYTGNTVILPKPARSPVCSSKTRCGQPDAVPTPRWSTLDFPLPLS